MVTIMPCILVFLKRGGGDDNLRPHSLTCVYSIDMLLDPNILAFRVGREERNIIPKRQMTIRWTILQKSRTIKEKP